MTQKILNIAFGVGILVVGFLALVHLGGANLGAAGAVFDGLPHWFGNALYVGSSQQFSVDSSGNLSTTGTEQVGASGTAKANDIATTCSMKADVSIAASSTGYAHCTGVTGVTSADTSMVAMISTSTLGWRQYLDNIEIVSAKASTTAGAIDFILYNGTGVANVPSAVNKTGSTTAIRASH
jgi:hypothetical protein